jgi:Cys-rich repeat protein
VTNLCLNNICVPCLQNSDCASGICKNGICANTAVLAETTTDPSQDLSDPSLDDVGNTSGVLPAQIIELPFTENGDAFIDAEGNIIAEDGTILSSGAPITPSTGPAALAVMLAGGAAGLLYRRRGK